MIYAAMCGKLRHVTYAGDTLRRLRESAGLTQEQLSKKSGIDRSAIVNIERGNIGLGPARASRLAKALRVDPVVFVDPVTIDESGRPLTLEERVAGLEERQRHGIEEVYGKLAGLEERLERLERPAVPRRRAGR